MGTWKSDTLDNLCLKMQSGGTPRSDQSDYYEGDIPFVTIEDITASQKYLFKTKKEITENGLKNSAAWIVPENSLMYSIYATLGSPLINKIKAATNQAILNLIVNPQKIDNEYLYYFLLSLKDQIHRFSTQTTQSNLNAAIVRGFEIRYPENLSEQSRIATILSTADAAIGQTEKLIAKYQRIKTGLMQDLLTKGIDVLGNIRSRDTHRFVVKNGVEVPEGWDSLPLHKMVSSPICYGIVQVGKHFFNGIKTIAIKDMLSDYESVHYTSPIIESQYSRSRVQEGDLLISVKATTGRIDVVPFGFEGNISRDIAKIRLLPEYNPMFYKYYFQSENGQGVLDSITVGSTRKEISIAPLKEVIIPVVPIGEQRIIVNFLNKISAQINITEVKLRKLKLVKMGLMQDLLSGRVRVN